MTIADHDTRLLPPVDEDIGPCRGCFPDGMEDHDWDPENLAYVCQVDGCECDDGAEYTLDDHRADEGDRAYSEYKESGPWD